MFSSEIRDIPLQEQATASPLAKLRVKMCLRKVLTLLYSKNYT